MFYVTNQYGEYFANFGNRLIEFVPDHEVASCYDTIQQANAAIHAYNAVYFNDVVLTEVVEISG